MPLNCCVPLCGTNSRKDPAIRYHEFPCDLQRREAWLKNISRQGPCGGANSRNAPTTSDMGTSLKLAIQEETAAFPDAIAFATRELSSELGLVPCESCKVLLQTPRPTGAVYGLTRNLDNGGLRHPTTETVGLCKLTCTFVDRVIVPRRSGELATFGNCCSPSTVAVLPHSAWCPELTCEKGDPDHIEELCRVFLSKLLRPLLGNWAENSNLTAERLAKLVHQPLSGEVLRL